MGKTFFMFTVLVLAYSIHIDAMKEKAKNQLKDYTWSFSDICPTTIVSLVHKNKYGVSLTLKKYSGMKDQKKKGDCEYSLAQVIDGKKVYYEFQGVEFYECHGRYIDSGRIPLYIKLALHFQMEELGKKLLSDCSEVDFIRYVRREQIKKLGFDPNSWQY